MMRSMRRRSGPRVWLGALALLAGLCGTVAPGGGNPALAQTATVLPAAASRPPPPRPERADLPAAPAVAGAETARPTRPQPAAAPPPASQPDAEGTQADATVRGRVTNLPLPRYVSLKSSEGNARRGPGITHRIDWVFTRSGMPLRIIAEHEHWRRVEDADGAGGWMHYAMLSGTRSVLVTAEVADIHSRPDPASGILARAERGVVARILQCGPEWCRLNAGGTRGWVRKQALWGIDPDERVE